MTLIRILDARNVRMYVRVKLQNEWFWLNTLLLMYVCMYVCMIHMWRRCD